MAEKPFPFSVCEHCCNESISYDTELDNDITSDLTIEDGGWYATNLKKYNTQTFGCTNLIPVKTGDKFKITATYKGSTPLVAEFDSTQTMVSYSVTADTKTVATDFEYTVGLQKGVNLIRLEATTVLGEVIIKEFKIVY